VNPNGDYQYGHKEGSSATKKGWWIEKTGSKLELMFYEENKVVVEKTRTLEG
jgi:hypothetical protein